ncbi:MAG: SirB2 family protein [Thiotrichaceae bacterium]
MENLITVLPYAHIFSVLLLVGVYLMRTLFTICNSKKGLGKQLNTATSVVTIILFATGITQAFLLKMPFSDSFVLIKIIGLLSFTAFGVLAFMPGRHKPRALLLLLAAFVIYIGLIFFSKIH